MVIVKLDCHKEKILLFGVSMKLIHISDIHIYSDPIVDCDPNENFKACMAHVEKYHNDADMVVITGDLTHRGQQSSYQQLASMLDGWKIDPLLMIGNHDHRPTFQEQFPKVDRDENEYVQYVRKTDDGHFIFLDTVEFDTPAGYYCKDRQLWLRGQLEIAAEEEAAVFLFLHHNPVEVGVQSSDNIGLVDGETFRSILTEYNRVIRHIFFGHCHFVLAGSVCGIPFSAPRSTNHQCVPDFSGVNEIGFAPMPPTYNVCLISHEAVVVHSIDFKDGHLNAWLETTFDT